VSRNSNFCCDRGWLGIHTLDNWRMAPPDWLLNPLVPVNAAKPFNESRLAVKQFRNVIKAQYWANPLMILTCAALKDVFMNTTHSHRCAAETSITASRTLRKYIKYNTFNECKDICLYSFLCKCFVTNPSFFDLRITKRSILQKQTYMAVSV